LLQFAACPTQNSKSVYGLYPKPFRCVIALKKVDIVSYQKFIELRNSPIDVSFLIGKNSFLLRKLIPLKLFERFENPKSNKNLEHLLFKKDNQKKPFYIEVNPGVPLPH